MYLFKGYTTKTKFQRCFHYLTTIIAVVVDVVVNDLILEPTFDDELDDVRRLSDDVRKGTRVGTPVGPLQPSQLNSIAIDPDAVVTGR